jgi:flagellar hook-associated protein 2
VLSASAVYPATPGNYNVNVTQLAQAQTLSSAAQSSYNTAIGSGSATTVTINFGTTSGTTFTADTTQSPMKVTIDSSNNTLQGIAQAINNLGGIASAAVVSTGNATNPYRLVITNTKTGAAESMQVVASGDATVSGLLAYDPANAASQTMTQVQAAQDAALTVNGIAMTNSTNTVSPFAGVSLSLSQIGTTQVTVARDNGTVQQNIDAFVTAYNTLRGTLSALTAYNTSGSNGVLIGDSTTMLIQSQLQGLLSQSVTGATGGLSTLLSAGIGFSTSGDGTLTVNDATLSSQLSSNPNAFAALFGTNGTATNPNVGYAGASTSTTPGTYAVNITQAATQSSLAGTAAAQLNFTTAQTLSVTLNGVTANVTVPPATGGTYASATALASAVQTAINSTKAFSQQGYSANVTANAGVLSIASTQYGSTSSLSVSGSGGTTLLGSSSLVGSRGLDIAGTIGGYAATGKGITLTGGTGSRVSGLAVVVSGTQTGALGTVSYAKGIASQMYDAITAATTSGTGSIALATSARNKQITNLQNQATQQQKYIDAKYTQYSAQFAALSAALSSMQNTSKMLTQIFNPTTTN